MNPANDMQPNGDKGRDHIPPPAIDPPSQAAGGDGGHVEGAGSSPGSPPDPATGSKNGMTTVGEVNAAASKGDAVAKARLSEFLDDRPDIVAHYGNIGLAVQQAWVSRFAGDNFLISSSLMRRLEALKRELAGEQPSPLEKLLVERVAACWLQAECCDLFAAVPQAEEGVKLAAFKFQRQNAAMARFLSAARTLAMIQRAKRGIVVTVEHTGGTVPADPQVPLGLRQRKSDGSKPTVGPKGFGGRFSNLGNVAADETEPVAVATALETEAVSV